MRLQLVPASAGPQWVRDGVRTFFRQPLAMGGLFVMFIAGLSLVTIVPVIGPALAMILVPAFTAGLVASAREAEAGRFPMPTMLFVAFRQGAQRTRSMLILGTFYAIGMVLLLSASALVDGGQFVQRYLQGGRVTPELWGDPDFRTAGLVALGLYLVQSTVFWHAPALVHWRGVPPLKSLFFSTVAVLRNLRAFLLYSASWMALSFAAGLVLLVLSVLTGSPAIAQVGLLPAALILASMVFCSMWFTFRDSFDTTPEDAGAAGTAPPTV